MLPERKYCISPFFKKLKPHFITPHTLTAKEEFLLHFEKRFAETLMTACYSLAVGKLQLHQAVKRNAILKSLSVLKKK